MGTSSGIFHSTTADKLAPFDDLESAVSRAGLRLINAEHKNTTTGFQHFGAESEKGRTNTLFLISYMKMIMYSEHLGVNEIL